MEKYRPMAIGVIVDVKLHNVAPVKQALIDSVGKIPVGEDLFYMYHPDSAEALEKKGEKIQSIYYFKKFKLNPSVALNDTTYILGAEEHEDYRRKVIYIADHFDENQKEQIDIVLKINEAQRFDCEYYFIGINCAIMDSEYRLNSADELKLTLTDIFEEEYGETLDTETDH